MEENRFERRKNLLIGILTELKSILSSLSKNSEEIAGYSHSFYENYYSQNMHEIQNDLQQYEKNKEKISALNQDITANINEWYSFIKDTAKFCRLTFPLSFYFKKKRLLKNIKKMNEDISNTAIENRFIKERITAWEQELEERAAREIRQGENFKTYQQLIKAKDELLIDLKYLLATIPGLNTRELDLTSIDSLIEKLSKMSLVSSYEVMPAAAR
jgi:hypothetical protein